MTPLSTSQRAFLETVSRLGYCNPFLPERVEWEMEALGLDFVEGDAVWSQPVDDPDRPRANVTRIVARLEPLAGQMRAGLAESAEASAHDLALYEDAVLFLIYHRYYPSFFEAGFGAARSNGAARWRFYHQFLADWGHFFDIEGVRFPTGYDPRHTFACFRQIQRAFEQVFRDIIGGSLPAARLRASIWQSIFTHDMRRYRRTLFARMGEFATLITGPSGTGKELVARAIAQSRYLPFDDASAWRFPTILRRRFSPSTFRRCRPRWWSRNCSATGAAPSPARWRDRKGWLETCPETGSVFLDELGDLDPAIQVKLLRVIETRTFHPVGDTAGRQFRGKLITATHRDLAALMRDGRFREDLYYRLCSDQVVTPSLAEQLADSPGVLRDLVLHMSRRVAGEEGRRAGARGAGLDRSQSGQPVYLAGELPRVGAVREERADPPQLPAVLPGHGRPGGGVSRRGPRREAFGGRSVEPLCDDGVSPHGELRGDGAAAGPG